MNLNIYRLDYSSKQEMFHLAYEDEMSGFGWMPIMNKIPDSTALDFIDYAEENLLNTNTYYTWRMMQKELHRWLDESR